jgi:hypothetical protein
MLGWSPSAADAKTEAMWWQTRPLERCSGSSGSSSREALLVRSIRQHQWLQHWLHEAACMCSTNGSAAAAGKGSDRSNDLLKTDSS